MEKVKVKQIEKTEEFVSKWKNKKITPAKSANETDVLLTKVIYQNWKCQYKNANWTREKSKWIQWDC